MGEESDMHDAALDAVKRKNDRSGSRDRRGSSRSRDRRKDDDRKGDDRKDDRKDDRRKRSRSKRSRSKRSRSRRRSRSRSRSRRRRSRSRSRDKRRSRSKSRRRSPSRKRRSWSRGMERGARDRSRDRLSSLPPVVGPPMPQPAPLRPLRPPPMRPPNFRPGDWMCPKCHFHNYRSKQVCPQCATIMPPGANAIQVDMNEPGRRKTKWDDHKPPDWVQDLVDNEPKPKPPPGVDPENFKVLKCEAVQIRALIGKGGETIRELRAKSGTQINIDHAVQDAEGTVAIIGDVVKTERMIKEVLESKGCPLGPKKPADPTAPKQLALPPPPPVPGVPPAPPAQLALPAPPLSEPVDACDVEVPAALVQALIGPGGQHIKDVRAKVGGTVYISVLPPQAPGGPQNVRVVGDKREEARDMVWSMVEELKRGGQLFRPPPPSLGGGPGMPPRGVTPPPPPPSMTGVPRPPPQPPNNLPPQPPSNLPGAGGAMAKPLGMPAPPPQPLSSGGCGGCDGGSGNWGSSDGSGGNSGSWGEGSGWGDVNWGDVPPGLAGATPAPGGPGMGIQAKGCPPPPNMMLSGELPGPQVVGPHPGWGGPGLAGPPAAAPPAPPAPPAMLATPGPGLAGPTGPGQQPLMTSAPVVMTMPAVMSQSEPPKIPPKQEMPLKPSLARAQGLAGLQALQNMWGRPRG